MKILYSIPMMALSAGLLASKSSADVLRGAEIGDVRLTGIYGGVLKRIVERNVKSVDVAILTDVFRQKTERNRKWQTEFWGKYMLSAVPYWQLTGDEGLSRAIDEGTAKVIALQEPDGYIGNYPPDLRLSLIHI